MITISIADNLHSTYVQLSKYSMLWIVECWIFNFCALWFMAMIIYTGLNKSLVILWQFVTISEPTPDPTLPWCKGLSTDELHAWVHLKKEARIKLPQLELSFFICICQIYGFFFSFTLDGEKLDCYLHFTNWKQTPKQTLMNRCSESFKGLPRVCGYDSAKSEAPGSLMFSPPNCLDIHFIPVKVKAQGCWRSRAVQSKSRWLELWIYYQVIMKAKER